MIDVTLLATTGLAFFFIAVSPGPATISNATLAMSKGRRVSLVYGAGLSFGLLIWGIVAATGLGAVLQGTLYLFMSLKLLGGVYLLWLAYNSFKSSLTPRDKVLRNMTSELSYTKWFWKGFILNTSNPKTVVAWIAALSFGLGEGQDILFLISAVMLCMLVGFFVNAMYSFLFSMNGVMNMYRKFGHWTDRVVAGVFAFAGVGLLKYAFSSSI